MEVLIALNYITVNYIYSFENSFLLNPMNINITASLKGYINPVKGVGREGERKEKMTEITF